MDEKRKVEAMKRQSIRKEKGVEREGMGGQDLRREGGRKEERKEWRKRGGVVQ